MPVYSSISQFRLLFAIMRFTALTLSATSMANAVALECSEDIVRNAESQGFVSSIFNCVQDQVASIGPQLCLAAFIADNATDNPFPITGTCRDTYQDLVDAWHTDIASGCTETELDAGAIPSDYACVGSYLEPGIAAFSVATGLYPFRMCTGAEVRAYAVEDAFGTIIDDKWNTNTNWVDGESACNYCYANALLDAFGSTPNGGNDASLVDECISADGPSDLCLSSTIIENARQEFSECAGYDVLFDGPACSAAQVAEVETLIPKPYYTFAHCAYNPATSFCSSIQSYFDTIENNTDSVDCLACYTELNDALLGLVTEDVDEVCGTDVFADDCLAYNQEPLAAFEVCSGITLNTDATTKAPTVVTTTTAAPAEGTTTTGATTTVAAETTKGAVATSVAGMLVIAVLSTLAL